MKRAVLVLLVTMAACFEPDNNRGTGPTTIGTTGDGSSSGGDCPDGSLGCACYGNGTCDPALECNASADVCVVPGCTPGQLGCECVGGVCLEGLDCVADVCTMPSSTSTTDTTAGSSESTDTVATSGCMGDPACEDCQACANSMLGPGGDCEDAMCQADVECAGRIECCSTNFGDCAACCRETAVDDAFWGVLVECVEQSCPGCGAYFEC